MTVINKKLSLVISRVRNLTSCVHAYELRAADGSELPLVTAGSHLNVPINLAKDNTHFLPYPISSNPLQRDFYEIAVSHGPKSPTHSRSVVENFREAMLLEFEYPSNNFHLHADSSPAVLIAEDIGIAPMLSLAYVLASRGRRFQLHYAGSNKSEMAFAEEIQKYFTPGTWWYPANENIFMDITKILADAPGNAMFYACGSKKMLAELSTCASAIRVDKDRIQIEYLEPEVTKQNQAVILELAYSNKLIKVSADQPLLNAVRDAGVTVSFDCCVGDCGSCAVKILEGEAEHRDHVLSPAQKTDGMICLCVSRAKSDKLVLAL